MSIATTWGTTEAERSLAFPCDELIAAPRDAYYRGITVHATAELLYRWLCQLRAAPYSYDWIDNFGRCSPRELTPGLDELAAGQRVMRIFKLVSFDQPHHLTVVASRGQRIFGRIAVSYVIVPEEDAACRLLAKLIVGRRGMLGLPMRLMLPWGDLLMMRKQFRTLKALAERDAVRTAAGA